MQLIASRHNLACLIHERPFDGINGSGKHCNWSVAAGSINLLNPGRNNKDNLRFLAFLSCVVAAVDEYQELLRASVASAGNDCRLGGNEAPPAIISIYLGDALQKIIDDVIAGRSIEYLKKEKMDLGVSVLPNILRDSADRNRTSPFAFTTNKFEFRMPGSQENLSSSVMVLNTAVAKSLNDFNLKLDRLLKRAKRPVCGTESYNNCILKCVSTTLKKHKRILFNGDGYSIQWEKEASKRGLANNPTTADALPCIVKEKSIKLFEKFEVLSKEELNSRYLIFLEKYNKLINIEYRIMQRMTKRTYLPAIDAYASAVATQISSITNVNSKYKLKNTKKILDELVGGMNEITDKLNNATKLHADSLKIENQQKRANFNAHKLIPAMNELRCAVDKVEHITSRDY